MKEIIAEIRHNRFQELLRHEEGRSDDQKIKLEITDVTALKVSLATLAECLKVSQLTLVNQRLYKVTAYFVKN